MATQTANDAREARRLKLAKEAAEYEALQADLKAHHETVRALEAAEKKRAEEHKNALKDVLKERGRLQAKATGAGNAMEALRQEYVPVEVRQALSAAAREERAANGRVERASLDVARGSESLASLKERARKISSEASARDIREEIKRVEEGQAALESTHASALEGLAMAEKRHEAAREAFNAAMSAARAL